MSLDLSKNISSINPSPTLEMVSKIDQLKKEGHDVIAFNIGEPDFDTPKHISDAIIKAIENGQTKYVNTGGILELRQAICEKLSKDNNLDYLPEQIVVTTGAKQALFESVLALVNPGDEVIIPAPCWVSYEEMVKSAGGKCVFVPTQPDTFQLDVVAIEKAISKKTKLIILTTPNNPTGCVYAKSSLERIAQLACEYDFYIISDEIYEKLIYDNNKNFSIGSLSAEVFDRTITINGFAKAYAMTGLRLGYLAAPLRIAKVIANLQAHMTSNASTPIQYGGVAALKQNQSEMVEMVEEFTKRRTLSLELLSKIPNIKYNEADGAFYLMLDVSYYLKLNKAVRTSDELALYLLENYHIALVAGTNFQAPNFLRFSYSNSQENITKGLERLRLGLLSLEDL